ncbi:MAG: MaoC family dehydratase [Roseiarcus sp.]
MGLLYFEDFPPGEVVEYGDLEVSGVRIKAFAEQFDPQPFHLDENAGRETPAGGLIASGWHTAAMLMRMNCDHFLNRSAAQGAPGIEEVNWLKPVRPGDRLHVRRTTKGARPSASRPELGLIDFVFEVVNHKGEVAMTQKNVILFKRRAAGEGEAG